MDWTESSSVNSANLVDISATISEIWNFSSGFTFFGAPCVWIQDERRHLYQSTFFTSLHKLQHAISIQRPNCLIDRLSAHTDMQTDSQSDENSVSAHSLRSHGGDNKHW